jgi:ABC-type transport system involved in multi-copper enzyme maturation permease subunit
MLSGSVSRAHVILGKFAGAFISIILPLSMAIILNLLIINLSNTVDIKIAHWSRIGVILLISGVYIAIFVWLGILISASFSRSSTSLLTLLLIWTVFVVLMPSILGSVCSDLKKVPSSDEISRRKEDARKEVREKHSKSGIFWSSSVAPSRENPDMKVLRSWADYLGEERRAEERINDAHLDAQMAQIHLARQITRISPTAIYRYALEGMSNTGFQRHRAFIANVRAYRDSFWEYIKSEDQRDRDSLHVHFVREGISEKPANFDAAPRFTERLTLVGSLQDALLDTAILTLFAVLFFMAAYLSFLNRDVR